MKALRVVLFFAGCGLLAACDDGGEIITAPRVPLAFTRFVNVVPDTVATDWRFIDKLENSPVSINLAFRSTTPYQATAPGNRALRVFPAFPATGDLAGDLATQNFLIEQTLTFAPETYYSLIHVGYSRAGQTPADELLVLTDAIPTVGAGQVAIRVVHMGAALGNVDVYASATGGSTPLPATPLFTNVPFKQATAYVTLPVGALVLRATATGTATVLAEATAPAGAAADLANNLTAIGGSTIAGSAITAILVPRSVDKSRAQNFTTPSWVYVIDKHPR